LLNFDCRFVCEGDHLMLSVGRSET
jgi:hypothetical protein